MEVSGQLYDLATLSFGEKPPVSTEEEVGCFGEEKNLLPLPGFESESIQPLIWLLCDRHWLPQILKRKRGSNILKFTISVSLQVFPHSTIYGCLPIIFDVQSL